ncbi:MAG: DUF6070 family protein [Lachnospiraceae bacterium]
MLLNKRKQLLLIFGLLSFGISGCSSEPNAEENNAPIEADDAEKAAQNQKEESKTIAECYRKIYEQANAEGTLGTPDTMKKIIECLGEAGYAAVDEENQVDMVHPDRVKEFIGKVEKREEAELLIICVAEEGGFTRFDLQTSNGEVQVTRSYLLWNEKTPEINSNERYPADGWNYSEEGYLFFEQYHMPGYDGAPGYTALRVEHLDEKCRALNRQYLLPIGYGSNNMFLTDWDEQDFTALDFYDLFHILYPRIYGVRTPYEITYEGALYDVSGEEFEKVIRSYFQIPLETLRSRTTYLADSQTYQYRTRGFGDWGWNPNVPYPEVVKYEENADGTLKLIVNAVYPAEKMSRAFSSEVVVRPLPYGGVQYVSNYVILSADDIESSWYVDRMSE